jgi:23S rRNA pseudouridine2605 synthase
MRLNAFLAQAGISSRRGADELIKHGRVSVNGRVGKLNDDVGNNDDIRVDKKRIKMRKSRYILLYKPGGYIATLRDPKNRRKVTDLVDIPERVIPVGRLDYDTTGALLLTNDGELANRLMHPSFEVDKVYEALVDGKITPQSLNRLDHGVELEGGVTAPARAKKLADNKIQLIIHEGRKHQVKKMLAVVGLPVKSLHRPAYAGLNLKGMKPGQWRDLTDDEIKKLKG